MESEGQPREVDDSVGEVIPPEELKGEIVLKDITFTYRTRPENQVPRRRAGRARRGAGRMHTAQTLRA